jgi:hypothetical protein
MSGQTVRTTRTDCPGAAADTVSLLRDCPPACPPSANSERDLSGRATPPTSVQGSSCGDATCGRTARSGGTPRNSRRPWLALHRAGCTSGRPGAGLALAAAPRAEPSTAEALVGQKIGTAQDQRTTSSADTCEDSAQATQLLDDFVPLQEATADAIVELLADLLVEDYQQDTAGNGQVPKGVSTVSQPGLKRRQD